MNAARGPHDAPSNARPARVALLAVSDTRTPATDRSSAAARRLIEGARHAVTDYRLLPDEPIAVREAVRALLEREDIDVVVVHGGSGISKRDRTPEALQDLIERPLPGFGELFRMLSYAEVGSAAMLSRAVGGIARGKALFSLPGSTAAVELALGKLILPELGHLLAELRR